MKRIIMVSSILIVMFGYINKAAAQVNVNVDVHSPSPVYIDPHHSVYMNQHPEVYVAPQPVYTDPHPVYVNPHDVYVSPHAGYYNNHMIIEEHEGHHYNARRHHNFH